MTDLCLGQFLSLRAHFFEDSRVKIHGSDPHTHWFAGSGYLLHLTGAAQQRITPNERYRNISVQFISVTNIWPYRHNQNLSSLFSVALQALALLKTGKLFELQFHQNLFTLEPCSKESTWCIRVFDVKSAQTFSGMKSGLLMYFCSFSRIWGLILSLS